MTPNINSFRVGVVACDLLTCATTTIYRETSPKLLASLLVCKLAVHQLQDVMLDVELALRVLDQDKRFNEFQRVLGRVHLLEATKITCDKWRFESKFGTTGAVKIRTRFRGTG